MRDSIPKAFGDWTAEDIELEEYYFEVLGTRDVLMRAYKDKNDKSADGTVYLYLIHSWEDSRKVAHPPELCIEGEGYELVSRDKIALLTEVDSIPANRMLFSRDGEGLLVYFWFRVHGENTDDYLAHQISAVFNKVSGSGASMIRLSIVVDLNDVEANEKILQRFVSEGVPEILKPLH